jgi:hypothetical protein
MPQRTDLASGTIHRDAKLSVELVQPPSGKPPLVAPNECDRVIPAAMRLLAAASVALANRKACPS